MIKITNLKLSIEKENRLKDEIAKTLNTNINNIESFKILKKSIDARHKPDLYFVYSVAVEVKNYKNSSFEEYFENENDYFFEKQNLTSKFNPVIVGCGPAGLFCAYRLCMAGLKPIIIERGKCIDERIKDVNKLLLGEKLDCESNVLFGEGGAGTFSDGKLTTGISSPNIKKVLRAFVDCGAPSEIEYLNMQHIGSDNLRVVIKNLREKLINFGATVMFEHKLTNINIKDNRVQSVEVENNGQKKTIETDTVVLAIGHSARDTFEMLKKQNFEMQPKNFSMGVRIEHSANFISLSQYGKNYKKLKNATYKLSTHLKNGRGVYSFCMCPGGVVMPAMNEDKTININGMSNFKRDEVNSNSALLVNVTPEDYMQNGDVLSGIKFQKTYEELAFKLANESESTFFAPVQNIEDFLGVETQQKTIVKPSYQPNVKYCDLTKCLPDFVSNSLKLAIYDFDKKIKGFKENAVLTGIETRSSSPVRVIRENFESVRFRGVYPCGEGCGYAGGIVSASVDGINIAEQIIKNLTK